MYYEQGRNRGQLDYGMHADRSGKGNSGYEHPFDQCGIVIEGKIEIFIDQERQLLSTNDCYFIPTGKRHGLKTFDKLVKILDISLKPTADISL